MTLSDFSVADPAAMPDTPRLADLRRRVRDAMEIDPQTWEGPERIEPLNAAEPVAIRKARAIAAKLNALPMGHWDGQLIAGSMTFEKPRLHLEHSFPHYLTDDELEQGRRNQWQTGCFGHIVPDYPRLLARGLSGIRDDVMDQYAACRDRQERAFLDSAVIALDAVMDLAQRIGDDCEERAEACADAAQAAELRQMAENLSVAPAGPAETFWQGLQAVWLVHMVFHGTRNRNAVGRADQFLWPLLKADLEAGRIDLDRAAELVGCFFLKFNERAKTTDEQRPDARADEPLDLSRRTRHGTSSQVGTRRDGLDATNHWLQNIVLSGLTPEGADGTNPLSFLMLEAYRRNEMTNPLLTVRLHAGSPAALLRRSCDVLRDGGGMPALFNDQAIVPALEKLGIPTPDARDYTNDGCWEVIIPGRTDFRFQRVSVLLCLERALGLSESPYCDETGDGPLPDAAAMTDVEQVWQAFEAELGRMVDHAVGRVIDRLDDRRPLAPVPLLSALTAGCIEARRDLTGGGARYRTHGMLMESASHCIDSLAAIQTVVFEQRRATMPELVEAMRTNFEQAPALRALLQQAPKYGNDDERADAVGRRLVRTFCETVDRCGRRHREAVLFPCGVATFSWYIGIGEGLLASADGRLARQPVASNFSPALGCDAEGLPGAILSYGRMHHESLPAGGPLDLRLAARLVEGEAGLARMTALLRSFVDTGGAMMTLTVVDGAELRAAQCEPEKYRSLRVRMGGWSAYFTVLSRQQQDHHIRRQEARS